MNLDDVVNTLGRHLKARYGERVRKLSLNAGFGCPNRDGTLGRGGCTFCSVLSFAADDGDAPLAQQLAERRAELKRAARYIAYFQAYTNTYAEVETLTRLYAEATASPDVVGLAVGTRPDCVPDAVLALLAGYRERGYEVWLELGLQSAHDETLARVNRGHGWAAYADAVARARAAGVPVCTHLILGLPGETDAHAVTTLERVLDAGAEGLKLHPLMITRGSRLAVAHKRGEIEPPELPAYAALVGELIRRTPPELVFHRVSATARAPTLVAPAWCSTVWPAMQAIRADLDLHGGQGTRLQATAA
ncbi:TIGR01212 family radical SAM protein [Rubrivivax gelatinosus]|uniref:Radical SAM domain-containing protein n=1 Tax=Rubrivivax gelatinosus (strain NBRC 100245 / IL144) TaxID=983917 RepID=I0HT44_RUBGI|nr:TIGR01212 family radical SAM protein [Rubrivivax gelatinosus]BAL96181.1 radical SAM domain-containing protein [Rubrivivax gelatinosus IL144]